VKRLQSEFSTAKKKTQDISANLQINGADRGRNSLLEP